MDRSNSDLHTCVTCKLDMKTLIDAGVGDDCHPLYGYTCNVQIEGRVAILPQRHAVRPGSVVEIIIHDDPSHGSELDGTEHVSLMQEALSLCRLPQSSATLQYFYDGDDAANYSWQQSAFICRDDGALHHNSTSNNG